MTVTFDVGTDLNTALVMVQNRVTLAMPLLPTQVQNQGITIRKRTPDILMIVSFYSPNDRYDDIYLSNYAMINIRDEVLRVDGVSDCIIFGERDYSIRAWLDPQKMAALRHQCRRRGGRHRQPEPRRARRADSAQPPAAAGQPLEMPIDALGRLSEPEQFGDIIVKVGPSTAVPMSTVAAGPAPELGCRGRPGRSPIRCKPARKPRRLRRASAMRHRHDSSVGTTAIAALVSGSRAAATVSRHDVRRRDAPAAAAATGGGATTGGGGTTGGGATAAVPAAATAAPATAPPETISSSTTAGPEQFVDRQRHQRRRPRVRGPTTPRPPAAARGRHRPAPRRGPRGNGRRRTTPRRRPSTAISRWASPSSNFPAPTPWTSPTA